MQVQTGNAKSNADANINSRVSLAPGSGRLTFNLTVTARPGGGGPGEEGGDLKLSQGTCVDKVGRWLG